MEFIFSGSSLEQCIEKASKELHIPKGEIEYKILKQKKHFFRKVVEIEVIKKEKTILENDKLKVQKNEQENKKESSDKRIHDKKRWENSCGAKVENGKIIVKDMDEGEVTIEPCPGIILSINGMECKGKTLVNGNDVIKYKLLEQEPLREANINIASNKLEAYITIKYVPKNKYELLDTEFSKDLKLRLKKIMQKRPPKYTVDELKKLLIESGIKNGILESELHDICESEGVENRIVAKGTPVKEDIPDVVKHYFNDAKELVEYDSEEQKVDYRNRYLISNVHPGDVLAELIPGQDGENGIDVFGMEIKRKISKKALLKAGDNCIFKDNKVISNIEGKPALNGNSVYVNKVYSAKKIDLKSGNLKFVGNVEIADSVEEGMEVIAGKELTIGKNVESASLQAESTITIGGTVISSTVKCGAHNVEISLYMDKLKEFQGQINKLINSVKQLKDSNLLGSSRYGEILKVLIENKFKSIPKLANEIASYNKNKEKSDIVLFISNKIIGRGPLRIKDENEIVNFAKLIDDEIDEVEAMNINSSDIYINYSQGSEIEASGNIFITGKGQYTSNITALGNIEFLADRAVCRGGVLNSGGDIKLKTVGSIAGVNTILKVHKNGRITADIAYNNTIFCFGEKQLLLDVSSKDVQAYLDKKGDIVIDKFIL